ncbi:hypothetical protein PR048_022269 [Dryococelus australis]|uniref:Uncharacterized protein n=1 Tax=Dryococelus australis TaxID=614101 RepID=A0ABQ9H0L1_9NEOP|nr:hypothetical protein PR048_022269 [Dryococelus australis]
MESCRFAGGPVLSERDTRASLPAGAGGRGGPRGHRREQLVAHPRQAPHLRHDELGARQPGVPGAGDPQAHDHNRGHLGPPPADPPPTTTTTTIHPSHDTGTHSTLTNSSDRQLNADISYASLELPRLFERRGWKLVLTSAMLSRDNFPHEIAFTTPRAKPGDAITSPHFKGWVRSGDVARVGHGCRKHEPASHCNTASHPSWFEKQKKKKSVYNRCVLKKIDFSPAWSQSVLYHAGRLCPYFKMGSNYK